MVLTGFFDNFMVAKVGHEELAAAGISNSIYFLISIFPMGVTIAFATIVGLLHGKNRINSVHLLVRDSFKTTIILCIITTLALYLGIVQFSVFKQVATVEILAKPYLTLLMWSLAPMLLFFFAKNICDGFGYTRGGMLITLTALGLNVFLNWVFIYGNLGSDALGLNGAGYATVISRIYMAISMVLVLLLSRKTPLDFKIVVHSFSKFKYFNFYKQIRKLGFPTGLQYFFEIAAFAFAAIMAGWLGSKELAAHQLAITLAALTYMFASGIAAGCNISVAKAMGQPTLTQAKNLGKAGHLLGFSSMVIFAIIFFVFSYDLAAMFSDDPEVIRLGSGLLILAAIFQLGDGLQAVSIGLLRGIEDVNKPSILTFIVYWIIAIPVGYYLSQVSTQETIFNGVNGIWIGLASGLTISAVILTYRFYSLIRSK
jgi:MATE family multidrug resistance protein